MANQPNTSTSTLAPLALGLIAWPSRPPAFDRLDVAPPDVLHVPAAGVMSAESEARDVIAKTTLFTGRDNAAAIAPVAGRAGANKVVTLMDGSHASAIELAVSESTALPEDVDVAAKTAQTTTSLPSALPSGDLALWIDKLASCGVGAKRIASPDLLGQLHLALRRPVDTILCNALDGDTSACVQSALAATRYADLIAGVALLARICNAPRRWIAIDSSAPGAWWSPLRRAARGTDVKLIELQNDYPQHDPTLLLYSATSRRLKPGRFPAELGVLVLDAAAAIAVGACALRGEPMTRQPMAVRDHERGESYFLNVPIGLSVGHILSALSIGTATRVPAHPSTHRHRADAASHEPHVHLLRGGDVLRDRRLPIDAVMGGGSELVLHVSTAPRPINPDPCIRCGWCFEACPTRVQPANVLEAAQRGDEDMANRAGIGACIECGICSYVCPSKLPILGGIRAMRSAPQGNL